MSKKTKASKRKARQLKIILLIALVVLPLPELYVLYKQGYFHDWTAIPFIYVVGAISFAFFVFVNFLGLTSYRKKDKYKAMKVSASIAIIAWIFAFMLPMLSRLYSAVAKVIQ